jgi:hypothetical protein
MADSYQTLYNSKQVFCMVLEITVCWIMILYSLVELYCFNLQGSLKMTTETGFSVLQHFLWYYLLGMLHTGVILNDNNLKNWGGMWGGGRQGVEISPNNEWHM